MIFRCFSLPFFVFVTAVGHLVFAEEPPLDFGFGPPEVIKLDWSTRALSSTDLNADGLRDLAVINNDAGKIELLYQLGKGDAPPEQKKTVNRNRWEPVLEDALFEKRALTVGFPVFDLAVHDLNGDGLVDLAYTSGEVPLSVRYQSKDGEWVDSKEFDGFKALGWTDSIKVADVDEDGRVELFVLSSDAIRVYHETADGGLSEPDLFYISGENPFNMMLFDVGGDGLMDLLYLSTDGKQILAMREQIKGGEFGPENRYVMERPARIVVPLRLIGDKLPTLGAVNSRSGALEFMSFAPHDEDAREKQSVLQRGIPDIYPIFKKVREPASYALGDVDGDGEEDLIVANPANAALVLFSKRKGRFKASEEFPSFSGISSMASGRFYKGQRESLIVLSEAEKTMGRAVLDAKGRLTFPRQIKIAQGNPIVVTAVDLNADDYDELLLVHEDEGSYRLTVAAPLERKSEGSPWEVLFDMELEGVRRKPAAIASLDLFSPGRPGVIVFVPREPPILLRPNKNQEIDFEAVATESSIRESLLDALSPVETSIFDVDGDGKNELVVAKTGFARAFRIADDQLEMVDQFNARRGSDVINAVIPFKSDSRNRGIALYIAEEGELQFLKPDDTGVFRYDQSKLVGRLELQDWYHLPASNDAEGGAFLLAGEDRFWYFGGAGRNRSWVIDEIYETDLEDIHYTHLAGADFDGDQRADLVALDGTEHIVDILSLKDGGFRSRMFWQVFEQNMHYQGRTGAKLEPRQLLIDDLTGDGLLDLSVLVHDRILIYPQQ